MSLSSVRTELETRLETITDLNVYKQVPDALGKLPAAIVSLESADYELALTKPAVMWRFRVLLLITESHSEAAYSTLDGYVSRTGDTSILAAIEGGSVGDFVTVRRAENVGGISYRGAAFVGAEFIVDVVDSS